MLSFATTLAQKSEDKQIITAVKFDSNKIFLNNKIAFNYFRDGNDFIISSLDGKEIIKGSISSNREGKISSVITFVAIGKEFSNSKIIGRNEIVFALCEYNVIKDNFEIDEIKLASFFEKYNELK